MTRTSVLLAIVSVLTTIGITLILSWRASSADRLPPVGAPTETAGPPSQSSPILHEDEPRSFTVAESGRRTVHQDPHVSRGLSDQTPDLIREIARLRKENEQLRESSVHRDDLHAKEMNVLRAENEQLRASNPATPGGALVRLKEYVSLSEEERRYIRGCLDTLPVMLMDGEGAWIAERIRKHDWAVYGDDPLEAIIRYVGPGRVVAELLPEKLEALRDEFEPAVWRSLFGSG